MTEIVEQWICIKFCVKLGHSSMEIVWMTQKATAMGNWWWQLHHNNMPVHQITQVTPPYSPDVVPCDFWLFPKLKSPLKGKRFQTTYEIQENTMGQLMVIRRTLWGPKASTLKETKVSLSYEQCFLNFVPSLINVSIFIVLGWILSGQKYPVVSCSIFLSLNHCTIIMPSKSIYVVAYGFIMAE